MANLNRVFLIGNLTRDPELRYTPKGTAVTNLGLAVNSRFKSTSGEVKEEVTFITVVVWGKQAETCTQFLSKGRPVFVEGRLQMRTWQTQDGQKRNVLEVRASRIQFLGKPQQQGAAELKEKDSREEESLETLLNGDIQNSSKEQEHFKSDGTPF